MPPLMISVWDAETRVSLAAGRAPGGNETAGTLAVLKTLVLKGCTVTADALHCHPAMAEGVQAAGADYALGLKGNHGPLYAYAVAAFAKADAKGHLAFHESSERGHDREKWRCASWLVRGRLRPFRAWQRSAGSKPSAAAAASWTPQRVMWLCRASCRPHVCLRQ
jgi:predicted transposase YbfD/YdcC